MEDETKIYWTPSVAIREGIHKSLEIRIKIEKLELFYKRYFQK